MTQIYLKINIYTMYLNSGVNLYFNLSVLYKYIKNQTFKYKQCYKCKQCHVSLSQSREG